MKFFWFLVGGCGLVLSLASSCAGANGYERFKDCIIMTEQAQARLVIANVRSGDIIWEWRAAESNIDEDHIGWFTNPSDAKVVYNGEYVIMSASGGACAMIRIDDKKTMFYVYGGANPHSVEILPDGNIVCSSSTDDLLTVFRTDTISFPDNPVHQSSFDWFSHNAVWDRKREVLWTGNMNNIMSWQYNFDCSSPLLAPVDSIAFEDVAGHDLFPVQGEDALYLSTDDKLWIYDIPGNEIREIETGYTRIKSISAESRGSVPIVSFPKERWWTDEIFDLEGNSVFHSPGFRIYKARWIVPNSFSYPEGHKIRLCR
jgi:hypothetical protein